MSIQRVCLGYLAVALLILGNCKNRADSDVSIEHTQSPIAPLGAEKEMIGCYKASDVKVEAKGTTHKTANVYKTVTKVCFYDIRQSAVAETSDNVLGLKLYKDKTLSDTFELKMATAQPRCPGCYDLVGASSLKVFYQTQDKVTKFKMLFRDTSTLAMEMTRIVEKKENAEPKDKGLTCTTILNAQNQHKVTMTITPEKHLEVRQVSMNGYFPPEDYELQQVFFVQAPTEKVRFSCIDGKLQMTLWEKYLGINSAYYRIKEI